jgi:dipeptidyl-peptidase-4
VTKAAYYQSAEESPLRRSVYKIDAKGTKTKLTTREGVNSASFSRNFQYYVNSFSNLTTPTVVSLHDERGKQISVLNDNANLQNVLQTLRYPQKEFFTFTTQQGHALNGRIMKPGNFDPNRQYPALMIQYSGPNSQEVTDRFGVDWDVYLASQGYVVVAIDGRGTGARGEEFRKCTYLNLGIIESDDQIAGAQYLGTLPYIDKNRIAIWGWSYGGYNVLMAMSRGNGIFKAGVAIAPVTDWRFYDTVYTERFMRTPKENESGYNASSPLKLASNLQGRLLLVHGAEDDNVHFQNTLYYITALEEAGKQFDTQIYPNKEHSIVGVNSRSHLYNRVIDFLNKNL